MRIVDLIEEPGGELYRGPVRLAPRVAGTRNSDR
jgi:hypothetical protein